MGSREQPKANMVALSSSWPEYVSPRKSMRSRTHICYLLLSVPMDLAQNEHITRFGINLRFCRRQTIPPLNMPLWRNNYLSWKQLRNRRCQRKPIKKQSNLPLHPALCLKVGLDWFTREPYQPRDSRTGIYIPILTKATLVFHEVPQGVTFPSLLPLKAWCPFPLSHHFSTKAFLSHHFSIQVLDTRLKVAWHWLFPHMCSMHTFMLLFSC